MEKTKINRFLDLNDVYIDRVLDFFDFNLRKDLDSKILNKKLHMINCESIETYFDLN